MTVIFLNGCTSAGKSSIAKALQDMLPTPHLRTGIDDAFAMLPSHLHNHEDGFYFDRDPEGLVRLNFSEFGLSVLKAHHRAAAAIARSGIDLILDQVVLTPELLADWQEVLQGQDVFWVGIHCDLNELERREVARGDRLHGQARGQIKHVHAGMVYDFEIDTTSTKPKDSAAQIAKAHAEWRRLL